MSKRTGSFRKITQIDRRTGNKIEISGKTLKEEDPKYALIPKESEAKEHTVTTKYLKPFEGNLLWLLGDDKKTQRKRKRDGANALGIFPGHVWAYLKEDTGEEKCKELRKYMYLKFCPKNLITKPQNPNNMSENRLKFRQFYNGEFHYWGFFDDPETQSHWSGPYTRQPVIPSEQFTGLHDKNGREIYEGDVVTGEFFGRGQDGEFTGVVAWDSSEDVSFYINIEGHRHGPYLKIYHTKNLSIIGNIHQTPN